ncbi:class I SAM-dependent methyltransferase [Nonomuraea typhae]|uniref:class I SAM-dependent methyltransferase n=1 Tax=Nonomuraea typhae TaxID=2603600 RepID=UPI0012FC1854|nr:methyltransferase domain-containing protein [Nonomuraea typhae]
MAEITLRQQPYIPGFTVGEYLDLVDQHFPEVGTRLWFGRKGSHTELARLAGLRNEFETDHHSGRGDSYRQAQRNPTIRMRGIRTLFTLASGCADLSRIPSGWRALDLLGGDGLLARVFTGIAPQARGAVITSDMAGHMVVGALRAGHAAVRQEARFLFMHDESVDAALLAYGTHHIAPGDRLAVCREAARVLRPGGRLVLHDFEADSPGSMWFSDVVHRYSKAGHPYRHFTAAEMTRLLKLGGLSAIAIHRIYDPLVTRGESLEAAGAEMADHLYDMYGLTELAQPHAARADIRQMIWKLAENYFLHRESDAPDDADPEWQREPVIYQDGSEWVALVPRVALVAVGEKR